MGASESIIAPPSARDPASLRQEGWGQGLLSVSQEIRVCVHDGAGGKWLGKWSHSLSLSLG